MFIFQLVNIDVGIIYGHHGQEEVSTIFENFDRIKELNGIIDYSINIRFEGKIKENNRMLWIYAYEGKIYEEYLRRLGLKYEDTISAGILLSRNPSKKEGEAFNIVIKEKEYQIPVVKITDLDLYEAMTDLDSSKIEKLKENSNYYSNTESFIISTDMAKNIDIDDGRDSNIDGHFHIDMRINSSNPNQLEKEIGNFVNLNKMTVNNYTKQKEDSQRLFTIMSIFLYGLLLVISFIGITNIYNTITASMNLRKREFETLRDIGMSNKQFNKMFSFESLLYGSKSLIIGTILGISLSYGIYLVISASQSIQYYFPFVQMIIMMVLTVMIIYLSIRVAWKKLN